MFRIYRLRLFMVLLITAAALIACGQKGPLYMPDEKQDEQKQNNEQNQTKG